MKSVICVINIHTLVYFISPPPPPFCLWLAGAESRQIALVCCAKRKLQEAIKKATGVLELSGLALCFIALVTKRVHVCCLLVWACSTYLNNYSIIVDEQCIGVYGVMYSISVYMVSYTIYRWIKYNILCIGVYGIIYSTIYSIFIQCIGVYDIKYSIWCIRCIRYRLQYACVQGIIYYIQV